MVEFSPGDELVVQKVFENLVDSRTNTRRRLVDWAVEGWIAQLTAGFGHVRRGWHDSPSAPFVGRSDRGTAGGETFNLCLLSLCQVRREMTLVLSAA